MQRFTLKKSLSLVVVIAGILAINPAFADKPSSAGHDKAPQHQEQKKQHKKQKPSHHKQRAQEIAMPDVQKRSYFDDRHRAVIENYYVEQFRSGSCPPGLRKKNNGCLPPGQAKKWSIGRQLPRNVIYYDLPPTVITQLGAPQPGYRYVRVDDDILLIALTTGLIVDAIQGLNWR